MTEGDGFRPLPGLPAEVGAAYDPVRGLLRLYGIIYSLALFQMFGEGGLDIGARIEIVGRRDGAVELRTLPPELPPGYHILENGQGREVLYRQEWEEGLVFPNRVEAVAYAWLDARPDGSAAAPAARASR